MTHPCASRSQTTFEVAEFVSIAPLVRCSRAWGPPWDGYYDLTPLPGLRNGEDYVAKLGEVCPVRSDALAGHRIACLSRDGLEARFHRMALDSLRFPETPMHYQTEATRVTNEINLWERWAARRGTEEGFPDWLNEPFEGQAHEDADGTVLEGSLVDVASSAPLQRVAQPPAVSLESGERLLDLVLRAGANPAPPGQTQPPAGIGQPSAHHQQQRDRHDGRSRRCGDQRQRSDGGARRRADHRTAYTPVLLATGIGGTHAHTLAPRADRDPHVRPRGRDLCLRSATRAR